MRTGTIDEQITELNEQIADAQAEKDRQRQGRQNDYAAKAGAWTGRTWRERPGIIVAIIVVFLLAVGGIAMAAHSASAPSGFHNMATLQASVTNQENTWLDTNDPGDSVATDSCISNGPNTAVCSLTDVNGDYQDTVVNVTISADGNNWISQ